MKKTTLFLIALYRRVFSMFFTLPSKCIYVPTCSEYAQEAFSRYPFFKAFKLSFFRIVRCNPLSKGGLDPLN